MYKNYPSLSKAFSATGSGITRNVFSKHIQMSVKIIDFHTPFAFILLWSRRPRHGQRHCARKPNYTFLNHLQLLKLEKLFWCRKSFAIIEWQPHSHFVQHTDCPIRATLMCCFLFPLPENMSNLPRNWRPRFCFFFGVPFAFH